MNCTEIDVGQTLQKEANQMKQVLDYGPKAASKSQTPSHGIVGPKRTRSAISRTLKSNKSKGSKRDVGKERLNDFDD